MKSKVYLKTFGVTKTRYKNMKKAGILTEKTVSAADIEEYRKKVRERRKKEKDKQKKKYAASLQVRKNSKPRKRRDGKVRGSVGPRKHI